MNGLKLYLSLRLFVEGTTGSSSLEDSAMFYAQVKCKPGPRAAVRMLELRHSGGNTHSK